MRQYPLRRRLARCTSLGLIPVLVNPVPPQFTPTGGKNFLSPHGDLKGRIRSVRVVLQVPATAGTNATARSRPKAASPLTIPRRFRPPGRHSNSTLPKSRHVGVPATAGTSATARSRQKAALSLHHTPSIPATRPALQIRASGITSSWHTSRVGLNRRPGPRSRALESGGAFIRRCLHQRCPVPVENGFSPSSFRDGVLPG